MPIAPATSSTSAPSVAAWRAAVLDSIGRPPSGTQALIDLAAAAQQSLPEPEAVRRELEALDVDVDASAEFAGQAQVCSKAAKALAHHLVEQCQPVEDQRDEALALARDRFLGDLGQAIVLGGTLGLVDDPELDVAAWVDAARALGVADDARRLLIDVGHPGLHARWLAAMSPLDRAWGEALGAVKGLLRQGQDRRGLAWAHAVVPVVPTSLWSDAMGRRAGMARTPEAIARGREELLQEWWGQLVAGEEGRGRALAGNIAGIIERHVPVGLAMVPWVRVLTRERPQGLGERMATPAQLQARVRMALAGRETGWANWAAMDAARPPMAADGAGQTLVRRRNGRLEPDAGAVAGALKRLAPATPAGIEAVLEALDQQLVRQGGDAGYARAWRAATLESGLGAGMDSRPRARL